MYPSTQTGWVPLKLYTQEMNVRNGMGLIGLGLNSFFAAPERLPTEEVKKVSEQLKNEFLLPWFDAIPVSILVINEYRQIVFTNNTFVSLTNRMQDELVGLRPGEALNCIHSDQEDAGCGCSYYCNTCGAAQAIIKSLEGEGDCQNCRLLRLVDEVEAPLDLQVHTKPIEFQGQKFILLFAMDVSHELRLRYMNRTFHHGLINAAGGLNTLSQLIESEFGESALLPLLASSSKRIVRDVMYHQDVSAGEQGRLNVGFTSIEATPFFTKLVEDECEIRNTQPSMIHMDIQCDTITTDKRILGHIIRNMFVNALEALENTPGHIIFRCHPTDEDGVVIIIENPGDIPENIAKQMFKRYVSTKSPDRGLGTYVIKLFVKRYLGGNVEFHTGEGKTVFKVFLP